MKVGFAINDLKNAKLAFFYIYILEDFDKRVFTNC